MQNIEYILSIAGAALGLLISTVTFILKFIKSEKAKKAAEQITEIGSFVQSKIAEAEKFTELTGPEKKSYVLEKVSTFAKEKKLNYSEESVSDIIESYINLTKLVNSKKE